MAEDKDINIQEAVNPDPSNIQEAVNPNPSNIQEAVNPNPSLQQAQDKADTGQDKLRINTEPTQEIKNLEEVIQREAVEEQETSSQFSISKTLGGVIIAKAVQKQMGLLLLISFFLIVYISNRYVCQKKLVEIDRMESKLVEARYKAIVCTSILTEKSRESNIMMLLNAYGDSTLQIPQDPPYLIKVPEEEE